MGLNCRRLLDRCDGYSPVNFVKRRLGAEKRCWVADVQWRFDILAIHEHRRQDKSFPGVECCNHLVAGDCDSPCIHPTTLHLDEPKLTRGWNPTFDIVSTVFNRYVSSVPSLN